jgi:hypothetical protein
MTDFSILVICKSVVHEEERSVIKSSSRAAGTGRGMGLSKRARLYQGSVYIIFFYVDRSSFAACKSVDYKEERGGLKALSEAGGAGGLLPRLTLQYPYFRFLSSFAPTRSAFHFSVVAFHPGPSSPPSPIAEEVRREGMKSVPVSHERKREGRTLQPVVGVLVFGRVSDCVSVALDGRAAMDEGRKFLGQGLLDPRSGNNSSLDLGESEGDDHVS